MKFPAMPRPRTAALALTLAALAMAAALFLANATDTRGATVAPEPPHNVPASVLASEEEAPRVSSVSQEAPTGYATANSDGKTFERHRSGHTHPDPSANTRTAFSYPVTAAVSADKAGPDPEDAYPVPPAPPMQEHPGTGWTRVSVPGLAGQTGFWLMLPPGWKFNELQGRDSYVAEITGGGATLLLDYGWYSWDLDLKTRADPGREYAELRENIGGLPAKILLSENPQGGHTGVYIGSLGGPMDGLLILGWGLTPQQQETALAIFRSIRVSPASDREQPRAATADIPTILSSTRPTGTPAQQAVKRAGQTRLGPAIAGVETAPPAENCPNRKAQLAHALLRARYPALAESNAPRSWKPLPRHTRDTDVQGS